MFPTLSGTNRTNGRDIELGGYRVPRNTMIWCNINAMFRDPKLWEDPDRYWPVSALTGCHACMASWTTLRGRRVAPNSGWGRSCCASTCASALSSGVPQKMLLQSLRLPSPLLGNAMCCRSAGRCRAWSTRSCQQRRLQAPKQATTRAGRPPPSRSMLPARQPLQEAPPRWGVLACTASLQAHAWGCSIESLQDPRNKAAVPFQARHECYAQCSWSLCRSLAGPHQTADPACAGLQPERDPLLRRT